MNHRKIKNYKKKDKDKARTGIHEPIPAELDSPAHVIPLLPKIAKDLTPRALVRTRGITPHTRLARGVQRLVRISSPLAAIAVITAIAAIVVVVVPCECIGRRGHRDGVDQTAGGHRRTRRASFSFTASSYRLHCARVRVGIGLYICVCARVRIRGCNCGCCREPTPTPGFALGAFLLYRGRHGVLLFDVDRSLSCRRRRGCCCSVLGLAPAFESRELVVRDILSAGRVPRFELRGRGAVVRCGVVHDRREVCEDKGRKGSGSRREGMRWNGCRRDQITNVFRRGGRALRALGLGACQGIRSAARDGGAFRRARRRCGVLSGERRRL